MHSCRKWIQELSGFFNVVFSRYPWHASCVISWAIPQTCDTVKSLIVKQLKLWEVIIIFVSTNKSFYFIKTYLCSLFRLQTAPAPVLTAPACPAARGVSTTSPRMSPRTGPSPALIRPRNTGSSWETVADKGLKFHLS